MGGQRGSTGQKKGKNFIRFAVLLLAAQLCLWALCNVLYLCKDRGVGGRLYLVEAQRVAQELREEAKGAEGTAESVGDISARVDLSAYRTITRVSLFRPEEAAFREYVVEDIDGILYRIEYVRPRENSVLWYINLSMGAFFLFSAAVLFYVWKSILRPFYRISELPGELAKGNLTMPVREEKSRYFGRFLWGMDMLRETLEADRQKELELQKEKRTLLLSLSHDIKTPLSAIELYAKALSGNLYDTEEKKEEALRGIVRNAGDIRNYIDEIARASREDFLNLEVKAGEFYLLEVVRDLEAYYRDRLSILHTEFLLDKMSDCLLKGDRDRMNEILQNLMENAVKYGDGRYIRLSCGEEEDCRLITVENAGCTLKAEELPHVFDSFYRGSNSAGVSGSGLGLYICRDLIRKMDGDIFVRLEGDVFKVTVVVRKV